jgi:hypothetical protein
VGAWRYNVAKVRSDVLHRGHRPTSAEARASVAGLAQLRAHICDRLAAQARRYPRTAFTLVGPDGLSDRDALVDTRTALDAVSFERVGWLDTYLHYLDRIVGDAVED